MKSEKISTTCSTSTSTNLGAAAKVGKVYMKRVTFIRHGEGYHNLIPFLRHLDSNETKDHSNANGHTHLNVNDSSSKDDDDEVSIDTKLIRYNLNKKQLCVLSQAIDPLLTPKGISEAMEIQNKRYFSKKTVMTAGERVGELESVCRNETSKLNEEGKNITSSSTKIVDDVEIVFVSTLRRALQTAVIGFRNSLGLNESDIASMTNDLLLSEEIPASTLAATTMTTTTTTVMRGENMTKSSLLNSSKEENSLISRSSNEKKLSLVALESIRESLNGRNYNRRKSISDLKSSFPCVDFSVLEKGIELPYSDEDIYYSIERKPTKFEYLDTLKLRCQRVLQFFGEQKETSIAVVCHESFMRAMLLYVLGLNEQHSVGPIPNCAHYTLMYFHENGRNYWTIEKGTTVECVPMPDGNFF